MSSNSEANTSTGLNKTPPPKRSAQGPVHSRTAVVERRNRTLIEAARTMLIFSKAPMFLWAEAVATACYTQNRSLIHTRHDKTPYELVHNKKPDLTFFRGLVPNPAPAIPYVPPTNKELEMLFQPMFDEYFNPPGIRQDPIPNVAQDPVIPTGPSVSISIDLDAPSGSHIQNTTGIIIPFASSSGEIMMPEPNQSTQPHEHIRKWTDSHPLDNIIGNPSRPVSTRKQLATDALWCFYNSVLSKVEPKNFKSAATEDVFKAPTYTVADNSLNAELAIYKEQVELYERCARWKELFIPEQTATGKRNSNPLKAGAKIQSVKPGPSSGIRAIEKL
ncbi:retrovirus-related pol polyprotein from transposon TNT 1-94 [Tanacetum coccineum]|uniref:Retrovirus-related pol polyprotein from transposon TNT 1-94 n=1 Tax=Tanacetum coccineum TaxID=301880 RepID=A0ABQ5A1U5_9ASTR